MSTCSLSSLLCCALLGAVRVLAAQHLNFDGYDNCAVHCTDQVREEKNIAQREQNLLVPGKGNKDIGCTSAY
jgi:hypothetical protein